MRVVIQRVTKATVSVGDKICGKIGRGLVVLVGTEDIEWISKKMVSLRIFNDEEGVMNWSLKEVDGDILLVSQFTLHARTKKGARPGYTRASKPEIAVPFYEKLIQQLEIDLGKKIQTGIFGADMKVELVNNGPVTILIDSKNKE